MDYDRIALELNAMRQVGYGEARRVLDGVRVTTTSAALLAEYAPQKLDGLGRVSLLDRPENDVHPLDDAAFEVLNGLFPCRVEVMWEEIVNGEETPDIIIEPVFNMSQDEIGEYVLEPENFGSSPVTSLMIFAYYLSYMIDGGYFELAMEHFHWSMDVPECCATSSSVDDVDLDRFYRLLDEHSLSEYALPFRIMAQANGNIFLDWTMDNVYESAIPYTMESIHKLIAEWSYAEPRVDELTAVAESFERDRWIASRLAELWDQCVRYKDGRSPRTLLEIFGLGDDEEENDD